MNLKLAIISPNQNAYSETFIQAHKQIPGVQVKFYYNGALPNSLEGVGVLRYNNNNVIGKVIRKIGKKFNFIEKDDRVALLLQSFSQNNIQGVLAEYGTTGVAMLPVCKKLNLPLFVHFHGYDAAMHDVLKKYELDYKEMFNYASAIFSVSTVMTDKLIELGCPKHKIIQNTYGPHPDFLSISPSFSNDLFIAVGRFVDKKAPYYTLIAFKEVLKEFPTAKLVMGGDGALFNTIKNLVNLYQLENNVVLPGIISREEYINYLINARAFVQHSITADNGDMEGTPVGILEACAAGVPVISTYHAGIPDVIVHRVNGLLCDEHDVHKMTQNMLSVLKDKNEAENMGVKAKETIQNQFTLERHLNELSKIILKHLNK